jgi:exosortase
MSVCEIVSDKTAPRPEAKFLLGSLGVLLAGIAWSYWPTFGSLASIWSRDPQYSHGYLVPLFALVLLWHRRGMLSSMAFRPNPWGLAILLAGAVIRVAGAYFYFSWLDMASIIPCFAGLVILGGGWPAWRWAWPGIAFLLFMLPLPFRLGTMLAPTLQHLATVWSTYLLLTLGFPAVFEGNIIILNDARIGVVEACGGLSMLVVFFALSTAVALLVRRPFGDKLLVVASAVPIALCANVARITLTAMLQEMAGSQASDVFHELAGWFMMPVALGLLWIELQLLSRLLIPRTVG